MISIMEDHERTEQRGGIVCQGLVGRRNGEILIKGYKPSAVKLTNSGNLMYNMGDDGSVN
jgi:hypothetical protein